VARKINRQIAQANQQNLDILANYGGEILSQFRYDSSMNQSLLLSSNHQITSQISSIRTMKSKLSTSQLSINQSFKLSIKQPPQQKDQKYYRKAKLF